MEPNRYGQDDQELRLRMAVAAQYDAPAYIRRAKGVEAALEVVLEQCRRKRVEWLFGVRLHIGVLLAGVTDWSELRPLLEDDDQLEVLERLHAEAGELDVPTTGPRSRAGRRRALAALRASVERFNRRWIVYIEKRDLDEINRQRDGYNRFYLLEKECAVGAARLMAQTFRRLPPFSNEELLERLPPLPVPYLA
jgi:hypothetical protein